ncbi:hypothetical protein RIF29_29527 [Crotalaria pallida]|uniref:Uncharacterized protein n=1 Tax=Crotalaria pallida TaxID=3830 RepID=A0AAN9EF58_CROPI
MVLCISKAVKTKKDSIANSQKKDSMAGVQAFHNNMIWRIYGSDTIVKTEEANKLRIVAEIYIQCGHWAVKQKNKGRAVEEGVIEEERKKGLG